MACDIQVVNPSVLSRIESFMNDSSYKEAIENSANYNTRLCIERRLRMPFLDSQTGVAQNHSNLFMNPRERIPGLQHGQLYTYPSKRWRKKRRQYLMQPQVALRRLDVAPGETVDLHTISTLENPAAAPSEDSKDSAGLRDDSSAKASQDAWYYDELELQGMEGFDEPDPDSDYDYEETYSKRRKKRGPGVKPSKSPADSPHPKKGTKGTGVGRGRKKGMNYTEIADSEKPFSCDLCGARYKTRPGLTYHYTHSHKEGTVCTATSGRGGGGGSGSGTSQPPQQPPQLPPQPPSMEEEQGPPPTTLSPPPPHHPHSVAPTGWTKFQDSYLTYLNAPGGGNRRGRSGGPQGAAMPPSLPPTGMGPHEEQTLPPPPHHHPPPMGSSILVQPALMSASPHHQQDSKKLPPIPEPVLIMEQNEKERAAPSTYCDFCLGDAVANKKSGQPEELVSCSDCGRSGHPSCLQFTDNMTVSVRKYRWQCIECKCCSICGTSDNDDQLLFCDDCDRGYHMYCLVPPLHEPPEGSWSCRLCLIEFHNK